MRCRGAGSDAGLARFRQLSLFHACVPVPAGGYGELHARDCYPFPSTGSLESRAGDYEGERMTDTKKDAEEKGIKLRANGFSWAAWALAVVSLALALLGLAPLGGICLVVALVCDW